MIYFKSILIENFESHKRTYLEFSPGMNMITGKSHVGKSSVMRAIRLVCYNEPCGSDSVRLDKEYLDKRKVHGHTKQVAHIRLEISDGHVIERFKSRGAAVNKYILTYPDGKVLEFNDFRNEVPQEIRDVLKFSYVWLGSQKFEANYLSQMDVPVIRAYQGANLASLINKLNNVDEFEDVLKSLNRVTHHLGEFSIEEKLIQDRIKRYLTDLEKMPDPTDRIQFLEHSILPRLIEAEKIEYMLDQGRNYLLKLKDITARRDSINGTISSLDNIIRHRAAIEIIDRISFDIQSGLKMLEKHSKISFRLDNNRMEIESINKISNIEISEIRSSIEIYGNAVSQVKKLQRINEKLSDVKKSVADIEKKIKDLLDLQRETTQKIDICPTCNQKLDEKSMGHVLSHIQEHN